MRIIRRRLALMSCLALYAPLLSCCAEYHGVIKPSPQLQSLAPELQNMTDAAIDHLLTTSTKPTFPAVVALARLGGDRGYNRDASLELQMPTGNETASWRKAADAAKRGDTALIDQLHVVNPLIARHTPTLKELRDSAALLHANILVVYSQGDSAEYGYNSAAIAYWSIIGLFCVPGDTVGHHTACYGLVIDTRTGYILAVLEGDSKKEEKVLPGAVEIARRRTASQAQAEAVERIQTRFTEALVELAGKKEPVAAASR